MSPAHRVSYSSQPAKVRDETFAVIFQLLKTAKVGQVPPVFTATTATA